MIRSKPFIELHQDYEREHLRDLAYLQATELEQELLIMREINEEEHRLPAKVLVIYEKQSQLDEVKDNPLPF